jgi:hypothetical protein
VSATLRSAKDAPLSLLREWLAESFRAIAPKKLVATLAAPAPTTPARSRKKSAPARRTARAAPKKRAAKARRQD